MSLIESEKKVQELIAQDKKDDAVKLLFDMVVACAKAKQFQKAEDLRQQILDVNSMALNEIINSAEIIESEKAKAIDQNHKKLWEKLYDQISDEETNDFYFSLKKIKLAPGKIIIRQGRINNRIFLIDSGSLNIFIEHDNKGVFLKNLEKGQLVGLKTFFDISLSTYTVITKEEVTLHYLEKEAFNKVVMKHAGFDKKLESLCKSFLTTEITEILQQKSMDRRRHIRFKASGRVTAHILNTEGKPDDKRLVGDLEDISLGGISFSIQQSNKETAQLLLGRQFLIKIATGIDEKVKLSCNGRVTSVQNLLFNSYLINFKFHKLISSGQAEAFAVSD